MCAFYLLRVRAGDSVPKAPVSRVRRRVSSMAAGSSMEWLKSVKGVILDCCGVLYDSGEGGGQAIHGSVDAVRRLIDSGLTVRFCTNETQNTRERFVQKLHKMGFDISFDGVDVSSPNCVVIGDAADNFSYKNLNEAFRVLIGLEKPLLFSLGQGRYYKETDGLKLDVGVFMKALEYACDVQAEVVGKPSAKFFQTVLNDMKLQPHEVVMIGDDLVNDVGGAQCCGMKGLQVRTGKYRPSDEQHPSVRADAYVDDLAAAADAILTNH
ncbi:Phospholysine phosphohistidine inorganic pyrophosphate phosphatase [Labeo rohita]|uniref:Phospholysine phosphohistidine inorganic pyrophosphate phosphatase n=1 Tax=Labeo rohita TaxID=84645 RepID=A0ABQ8M7J2_LABRO|nr:Phospholysine phosphohistidine inorganic pyrophosphate phosphatase [Labeo rohita]